MKKFFATVLALCLICGTTALATEVIGREYDTEVRYTVEKCTDYTVTIPPVIELQLKNVFGSDFVEGKAAYSLDVSKINTPFKITVALTAAENGNDLFYFYLKRESGDEKVPYSIAYSTADAPNNSDSLVIGREILNWTFGSTSATSGTLWANAINAEDFKKAGVYTDQLTFTVKGGKIVS